MEQPQVKQQPAQVIAETVTDDDKTVEHEGRERRQPERLTYPREHMGAGHSNMQHNVAFADGITPQLEMNHNLIVEDMNEHCFEEYEEHLVLIFGRIMVGIHQVVTQKSGEYSNHLHNNTS